MDDEGMFAPKNYEMSNHFLRFSSSSKLTTVPTFYVWNRKSTFRSGTPPPPPVIGDFYKQLFWYGFDPDNDATSPADKTMFGGTKGKFNGLAYLGGANGSGDMRTSTRPRRQQQSSRERNDDFYYDDDDQGTFTDTLDRISNQALPNNMDGNQRFETQDDDYNFDVVDDYKNDELTHKYSGNHYFVTPPNDQPRVVVANLFPNMNNGVDTNNYNGYYDNRDNVRRPNTNPQKRRRPRKSPWDDDDDDEYGGDRGRNYDTYYDEEDDDDDYRSSQKKDWVSQEVSNWFTPNNDNQGGRDNGDSQRNPRRKRSNNDREKESFLWDVFEGVGKTIFGTDNKNLNYQAEMYNRQMGIGGSNKKSVPPPRNGRSRPRKERRTKGYAYRYDVDLSDYDMVVDADIVRDEEERTLSSDKKDVMDVVDDEQATVETTNVMNEPSSASTDAPKEQTQKPPVSKERSWEERALAMERIPPPGVPAWGPSGDLGMDARMKATIDALQDIQEAEYRLKQRKEAELDCMDDITILKV